MKFTHLATNAATMCASSSFVKQTPGAIEYVELIYTIQNKMSYAEVKNAAGEFVEPTRSRFSWGAFGEGKRRCATQLCANRNQKGIRLPAPSRSSFAQQYVRAFAALLRL